MKKLLQLLLKALFGFKTVPRARDEPRGYGKERTLQSALFLFLYRGLVHPCTNASIAASPTTFFADSCQALCALTPPRATIGRDACRASVLNFAAPRLDAPGWERVANAGDKNAAATPISLAN